MLTTVPSFFLVLYLQCWYTVLITPNPGSLTKRRKHRYYIHPYIFWVKIAKVDATCLLEEIAALDVCLLPASLYPNSNLDSESLGCSLILKFKRIEKNNLWMKQLFFSASNDRSYFWRLKKIYSIDYTPNAFKMNKPCVLRSE